MQMKQKPLRQLSSNQNFLKLDRHIGKYNPTPPKSLSKPNKCKLTINENEDSSTFSNKINETIQKTNRSQILPEILEKKIAEMLEKNKLLEKAFCSVLQERNQLKSENFHLLNNLRDEENKINLFRTKIQDLETELMESHEIIIDLEKKQKNMAFIH